MLLLGNDVLTQHIFPILDFRTLLSVRLACQQLQAMIDNGGEWDRRYHEVFPFDSRKPPGSGLERFVKRVNARLRIDESDGNRNRTKPFQGMPIIDFSVVRFPAKRVEGVRDQEIEVFVARVADSRVFVYTSQHVRAIIYTRDVTRINLVAPRAYIRGWCDGKPVKFNLRTLDAALVEPYKVLHYELAEDLKWPGTVDEDILKWLERHPQAHEETRLDFPSPMQTYFGTVCGKKVPQTSLRRPPPPSPSENGLFEAMVNSVPRCPDTLRIQRHFLEGYIMVCSTRNTVYVISPTFPFETNTSYKTASFRVENTVTAINCECVLDSDRLQVWVDVLDEAGNFETYRADVPSGQFWYPCFELRFPRTENVVEMVGDVLLFEDGTLWNYRDFQCIFDLTRTPSGNAKLVRGVVMIRPMLYLSIN